MKKLATAVFSLALITLASSAFAANAVRISQVYGGGAGSGSTYTHDYVELFNSSGVAVDISGWALEYGSATGNWGSSAANIYVFPQGTRIEPCKYLLVSGASGTVGLPLPVTADHSSTLSLAQSSGKVALFTTTNANLACGSEIPGTIVDKVAYGTGTCAEGTAAGATSQTTAAIRKVGGLTDTDNNSADFTIEGSWAPRNSASPANVDCLATPATPRTWGSVKNIYR